jgi:hypothetical protein
MLRSHPSSVVVLKYWAPIVLFLGTFVFWNNQFRWAQLIFLIPMIVGLLFHASLAVLQIPDETIRYRRFLDWKRVSYDEIVECGVSWEGRIGYLRLKHFLFPWGKLYLVLDQNEKLFGRGTRPLLRHIQERVEG